MKVLTRYIIELPPPLQGIVISGLIDLHEKNHAIFNNINSMQIVIN